MKKQDRIKEYNKANAGYWITDIKKLSEEQIKDYRAWGVNSIYELYASPSHHKVNSWNTILRTYNPQSIISVQGSSHAYSVLLVAENGDTLHITKANNYLVDIV